MGRIGCVVGQGMRKKKGAETCTRDCILAQFVTCRETEFVKDATEE
jgi:hypothetical protein